MKLLDFIYKLNYEAALLPNMGRICDGDIYELNHYQNVKYPAFCATQLQHSEAGDWRYYQFNLFYVDRLTSNHGNAREIQSEAVDALSTIVRNITKYGVELNGSVLYDTFTERFDSECAGAYATVTFAAMVDDICPQWYAYPIRKIYYKMRDGIDPLEDSDISITGDGKFLYNDREKGVIGLIITNPNGYVNFDLTREGTNIDTIDFHEIDIEFRLGDNNGLGLNYAGLNKVVFPDTLTYLGLMQGCQFSSVTLPDTVTYIGHTFYGCENLEHLVYKGTKAQFNAIQKFSNRPEYPYDQFNWHGGETAPLFCSVICLDGILEICKHGCECDPCPTDSFCEDCPAHCEDYCDDCQSDCPSDGACTSDCPSHCDDAPCSDCVSDCGIDCNSDCAEDFCYLDCITDGVCESDCSSDQDMPDVSGLTGCYRMVLVTNTTEPDPNARYVLADANRYVYLSDTESIWPSGGDETLGGWLFKSNGYTLTDGYITNIEDWEQFRVEWLYGNVRLFTEDGLRLYFQRSEHNVAFNFVTAAELRPQSDGSLLNNRDHASYLGYFNVSANIGARVPGYDGFKKLYLYKLVKGDCPDPDPTGCTSDCTDICSDCASDCTDVCNDCPTDGVCTSDCTDAPCSDCASDCPSHCEDTPCSDCASDCPSHCEDTPCSDCSNDCGSDCSSDCSADAPQPVPLTPLVDGQRYVIYTVIPGHGGRALSVLGSGMRPATGYGQDDTITQIDMASEAAVVLTASTSGDSSQLVWVNEDMYSPHVSHYMIIGDNVYSGNTGVRELDYESGNTPQNVEMVAIDGNYQLVSTESYYNGQQLRLYCSYNQTYDVARAVWATPETINQNPDWTEISAYIFKYTGNSKNALPGQDGEYVPTETE